MEYRLLRVRVKCCDRRVQAVFVGVVGGIMRKAKGVGKCCSRLGTPSCMWSVSRGMMHVHAGWLLKTLTFET